MTLDIALKEVNCPICMSNNSTHVFFTQDYLFGISSHYFGVRRCSDCGAGFLSPRPSDIRPFYPENFYWAWEGTGESIAWSKIVESRSKQLSAKADWLGGVKPGKLLDIGCQKGEFLWYMREQGWEVEGVELDADVPNPADMPVLYGDFLTMDFGEKRYDLITFWAVLEHVESPSDFFSKASSLLNPGGRIVVLVTNFNSIQSRIYGADDFPRHLTLFTRRSIDLLCESNGLSFEKLKTDQSIFGGSLNGGLIYGFKRLFGYTVHDAMREWKQNIDPDLFWTKWKGKSSIVMWVVAKIDRVITLPFEKILDRTGYGFILTFSAIKKR